MFIRVEACPKMQYNRAGLCVCVCVCVCVYVCLCVYRLTQLFLIQHQNGQVFLGYVIISPDQVGSHSKYALWHPNTCCLMVSPATQS